MKYEQHLQRICFLLFLNYHISQGLHHNQNSLLQTFITVTSENATFGSIFQRAAFQVLLWGGILSSIIPKSVRKDISYNIVAKAMPKFLLRIHSMSHVLIEGTSLVSTVVDEDMNGLQMKPKYLTNCCDRFGCSGSDRFGCSNIYF